MAEREVVWSRANEAGVIEQIWFTPDANGVVRVSTETLEDLLAALGYTKDADS